MEPETFTIITNDGLELVGNWWQPKANPVGVVCLVHGLGEHQGRYQHVIEHLGQHLAFFTYDQRGHGKSPGKRGHAKSFNHLMNDVESLLKIARREYNSLPIYLYGHSMGGNIVANYLLQKVTTELAGAILSSSFLKLAFEPPSWKLKLGQIMASLWPAFTQSNELDPSDLSTDPGVGKDYLADPLVHNKISAGLFFALLESGSWALNNVHLLKLPVLVMHGTSDPITSSGGSEKFAGKAGSLATLKLWEGMKHEIHNEIEKEQVLNYLKEWLLKK